MWDYGVHPVPETVSQNKSFFTHSLLTFDLKNYCVWWPELLLKNYNRFQPKTTRAQMYIARDMHTF